MKKMKLTALCLSAAIALSTISAPAFASTEIKKGSSIDAKGKMIISLGKADKYKSYDDDDDDKEDKKKSYNFQFSDSEDYMENMGWAIKAIEKLGAKGIISGYSDKSYKPQNKVTNIEALSLILKLTNREEKSKSNEKNNSSFSQYQKQWDLKWGWGYMFVAIDEGILLPGELKDFNPNQPIKRHEVAKYLIRAIGQTKDALNNMDSKLSYQDKDSIPKASRGYVYIANELGIMTGNGNSQFKPNEPVTRAEIAVLIDKADGYLNNDNGNENEAKVVFSSYDKNNDRLYVKDNGNSIYYNTIKNVMVYKNNTYTDINDLVQGDVIEIVFNNSKQVIFIEVTKEQSNDNNYDERISFEDVNYNNLPTAIKKDIDTLRATKGYKTYRYENKIYLAVFMGKKNTGGYAVNINDLYRYEQSNGKYRVEAVVEESTPSSDSMVTQAITYPYTVVRFNSFDTIEKVSFVDTNGNILAQKSIENLNNQASTTGVLSYIDKSYTYIKVIKDSKLIRYDIASDAEILINNKIANIEDLKVDMNLKLTLLNDEVIKISADYDVKEIKGTIQNVDTTKKEVRVNYNNRTTTYTIMDNAVINLNGNTARLSNLKAGMEITLELVNNKITQIDATDIEEAYEGRIKNLRMVNNKLKEITLLIDGTQKKYEITENTKIVMMEDGAVKEDLAINSIVEIKLLNGELIEIEEK